MEQSTIAKTAKKHDHQPGIEAEMDPRPEYGESGYSAAGKLKVKSP
jgi:hypothetical protein